MITTVNLGYLSMVPKQNMKASTSIWHRAGMAYINSIRKLYLIFKKKHWKFTGSVLVTILTEPLSIFRGAYFLQTHRCQKNYANINPTTLTGNLLHHSPLFLVHGDHSNSGMFTPLINYLAHRHPLRPIFTVDLTDTHGIVSETAHLNIIMHKIHEITRLYPPDHIPQIVCIGHSNGADVLAALTKKMRHLNPSPVGALIKIGSAFSKEEAEAFEQEPFAPTIEMIGIRDVIKGNQSYLRNHLVVPAGHVSLLFHRKVFEHISHLLIHRP